MNASNWFICLIIGCLACSKPSTTAMPSIEGPYRVTALLNDSTWFGSASASKVTIVTGQSVCTTNRFNLSFSTDLPFDKNSPKSPITGCLGDCIPTQSLGFRNVPLAVGKYEIVTLNTCAGQGGAVEYYWILGGDGIINTYNSKATQSGWIQVTAYNAGQNALEGSFEVDLSNQAGNIARFQKGAFKALVQ